MARRVRAGAAVALLALPATLAFFSGGFFDQPRLWAAVGVWAGVIAVALVAGTPLPRGRAGRLAVAGLALLCAWTALSLLWAPLGGRAQDDLQRLLLYLGAFVAAMAVLRHPRARAAVEPALAGGAFAVVAYGLSERLFPTLLEFERSSTSANRLEQPLTYWNAMGIAAVVGILLAMRVAGDPSRPRALRAAAAAAGVPLGLGVYLTFARGALVALAIGVLLLLALAPEGRAQLRAVAAVLLPAVAASVIANALPSVESLESRSAGEGAAMLAVLVALSAAAAWASLRPPGRAVRLPVGRPAAVAAVAAVALVAGGLAIAALEGKPETTSPIARADPERLATIDTNRYRYWEEALAIFAANPLQGVGSGGFHVEWLKVRDRVDPAADAHSLYLETAAELGVVGLAALLLFAGAVAAALVALYRRAPALAAGPAAALAAWAFHAGIDWDWEMPAVTLPALLLAGAVVAAAEEAERGTLGKPAAGRRAEVATA